MINGEEKDISTNMIYCTAAAIEEEPTTTGSSSTAKIKA
jgi:hypothetical protein